MQRTFVAPHAFQIHQFFHGVFLVIKSRKRFMEKAQKQYHSFSAEHTHGQRTPAIPLRPKGSTAVPANGCPRFSFRPEFNHFGLL